MFKKKKIILGAGAFMVFSAFGTARAAAAGEAGQAGDPLAGSAAGAAPTVTVTARRRLEKEQDVPAPISVASGSELEAQGLYQIQDMQQALPSLSAQFLQARQSSLAVRGIGNNTANEGLEGSVGIYLDNVFLGRPGQAVFDLLDLEQVDLLRGPQGTLFGKNTTAGVLNITTRKPTFDPEGSAETLLGTRGLRQFRGMYSGPLSDTVAWRIAAYDTHDDGWLKNLYDGRRLNEINRGGVRGQLLFKPQRDFSLRLIAEHNQEDSSTGTLVPYAYGPLSRGGALTGGNLPGNATTYAAWIAARGARQVIGNPYDYEVSIDARQHVKIRQNALSAEANWKLGDYALTSISAWRDWSFKPENDIDSTSLSVVTGGFESRETQFSQELRLASPTGKSYDYVIGAYLYHQRVASHNNFRTGSAAAAISGNAFPNNNALSGSGEAETSSYALFGQHTWHATPRFDLSAGLRLTSEEKEGHVWQSNLETASPFSAYPIFAKWDSGQMRRTDRSPATMFNASYRLSARTLAYLNASTGAKSGGYNLNSVASAGAAFGVGAITLAPEKARSLDLGVKSAWFEQRLSVNANLFLTKVDAYQAVTTALYAPLATYLAVLANVGDLTSKGAEFDIKARPVPNWSLGLNGAYTDARFDSGSAPAPVEVFNNVGNPLNPLQGYGKGNRSIAGKQVNGAPRWILNASTQYRMRLDGGAEHYINASYAWRSDSYGDLNNSAYSRLPAYGLANASIGWRIPHGQNMWDLSLFARNAFDKHYFLGVTSLGSNAYAASAAQPRTIGASAKYIF